MWKKSTIEIETESSLTYNTKLSTFPKNKCSCMFTIFRLGYRGLDTASVYNNEKECAKAINDSGIPREDIVSQILVVWVIAPHSSQF